jgi:hypothetical protein
MVWNKGLTKHTDPRVAKYAHTMTTIGRKPWLGKKRDEATIKKMSDSRKGKYSGSESPSWKGDDVGYFGLHQWIAKEYGSPSECEGCGSTEKPRYEWANVTGQYKRERSDWQRLCVSCHRKKDHLSSKRKTRYGE